jgi:transcriptional regulator with XRE-family HTH domain
MAFTQLHDPTPLRMARLGLNLTQEEVAETIKMSVDTITKVEAGKPVRYATLLALVQHYSSLGAEFKPDGWVRVLSRPHG